MIAFDWNLRRQERVRLEGATRHSIDAWLSCIEEARGPQAEVVSWLISYSAKNRVWGRSFNLWVIGT